MRFTRASDLALRVLMLLAAEPSTRRSARELADILQAAPHHLAKVTQSLARQGWVRAVPGRGGGVAISPAGEAVTPGEVVRVLDGVPPVIDCIDLACPLLDRGCQLRPMLERGQASFLAVLDEHTVAELAAGLT